MLSQGRRARNASATRAALLSVGRSLFAKQGYFETGTEQIVAAAEVTRGALYHHYQDKEALFEAVFRTIEEELTQRTAVAVAGHDGDLWERSMAGWRAYLDAAVDSEVQRIIFAEGPVVLGMKRWREIDATYGMALLDSSIEALIDEGFLPSRPVKPLAHLAFGALVEAATVVAHAEDQERAREEMACALDGWFGALRKI